MQIEPTQSVTIVRWNWTMPKKKRWQQIDQSAPIDHVKKQLQSKRFHVKIKDSSKIYKRAKQKLADTLYDEEGERVTRTDHKDYGH